MIVCRELLKGGSRFKLRGIFEKNMYVCTYTFFRGVPFDAFSYSSLDNTVFWGFNTYLSSHLYSIPPKKETLCPIRHLLFLTLNSLKSADLLYKALFYHMKRRRTYTT